MQDINLITNANSTSEPNKSAAYRRSPELQKLEQLSPHIIRAERERDQLLIDLKRRITRLESILRAHGIDLDDA